MNIGVGSILTNGLGGSAYNMMIFGPLRLYVEPYTPTPTVTPTITPTPTPVPSGGNGGSGGWQKDEDSTKPQFKIIISLRLTTKRLISKEFIISERRKDVTVKRIGEINTLIRNIRVCYTKIYNGIKVIWKKSQ